MGKVCFSVFIFLVMMNHFTVAESFRINLVSVGKINQEILSYLKDALSSYFDITKVDVIKKIEVPGDCFNSERGQFLGECILKYLPSFRHSKTLGLIDRDLYSEGLNFIFGVATSSKAVVALPRLKNEFYGLEPNKDLFYLRILKEANHELGHCFGLSHCSNSRCIMYFSNSLMDTDKKPTEFCKTCRKKLKKITESKCVW